MKKLLWYVRLGKLVYGVLRERFPQLPQVPFEDLRVVIDELLRTSASIADAQVIVERAPTAQNGQPRQHHRLVIARQPGGDGGRT